MIMSSVNNLNLPFKFIVEIEYGSLVNIGKLDNIKFAGIFSSFQSELNFIWLLFRLTLN